LTGQRKSPSVSRDSCYLSVGGESDTTELSTAAEDSVDSD